MKRLLLSLATLAYTLSCLHAQVVYSDPAFPTSADEVTVFFDASEGNAGLEDCGCDVYLHSGVITNESNSSSDWRYVFTTWGQADPEWRMEPVSGEPNLYSYTFSPSVREFYGVPSSEEIEQISFVFRNADGSQAGRAADGGDVFLDLSDGSTGFTVLLQSPTNSALVVQSGETIPIRVVASEDANFTVTDNDEELINTSGQLLEYDLIAGAQGTHIVEITVDGGGETQVFDFAYAVPVDVPAADVPAGLDAGVTFTGGTLRLNLYAPGKEHVFVLGSFNDYRPLVEYQMTPSASGSWWIEIEGLDPEGPHTFQYLVDGSIRVADPYSKVVLDEFNDPFLLESTYPDLPPYPEAAQGIVTLVDPSVREYDWEADNFERPEKKALVIYELLLRDFLESHSYTDLIDTLSYLERLGVNAIELMPVNEFEGNISWGYNPSFHMALDKYYGPIYEFKRFVDECHKRGIAVIVDVVYNHAFSQSPLAQLYWDEANFRPSADNPWLNVFARHPFNVGFDFDHESQATKEFVKRVMRYWLEEFRLDGFRFDLSKGFTQNQTSDVGAWSAYDASRIAIIKDYADAFWGASPGAYAIMEHFGSWEEELELAQYGEGMLFWNNQQPQYKEAVLGYSSNLAGAVYKNRGWDVPALVSYMESHDEERLIYEALEFGNSQGNYNVKDLATALDRVEAASNMFYTIPGPKMLWQFGEVGYDFSINYCVNGTINPDCRTGPKPIRWDYLQDEARSDLYERTAQLIRLTQQYDNVFCTDDFEYDLLGPGKKIQLFGEDFDAVAIANLGVEETSLSQVFPVAGEWYEVYTGEVLNVVTPNILVNLEPGEYRLYTSEPIELPNRTREQVQEGGFGLELSPNPTDGPLLMAYDLPAASRVGLEVFNLQGQRLWAQDLGQQTTGWNMEGIELDLPAGAYILKLTAGNRIEAKPFVVR